MRTPEEEREELLDDDLLPPLLELELLDEDPELLHDLDRRNRLDDLRGINGLPRAVRAGPEIHFLV